VGLSRYLGDVRFADDIVAQCARGDSFYAILGQSNAEGIADYSGTFESNTIPIFNAEDQAESYETPFAAVNLSLTYATAPGGSFTSVATRALQPYASAGVQNMGFELTLGRFLNKYGPLPPYLAKYAVGGSSLAGDWLTGNNYAAGAIAFLQARQAEFGGRKLGGVFWDQGEADATDSTQSANYAANLTTLVAMFRAAFGPQLSWVFKRLSVNGTQTFNSTVRTQQANYAASDANSAMIDTDDTRTPDNLHYDARSCQLIGDRYANAMLALRHPVSVPGTTYPYFAGADAQRTQFTTTQDIRWWGGTQAGDVGILAVVGSKRNQAPLALTTPAGFTLIGTAKSTDSGTADNAWVSLYWCRADSVTMAANNGHMPAVTIPNSNHNNSGKIYVFRNCVATGVPYDAVASIANNAYGTSITIPGATTVQPNQLAVMIVGGTVASTNTDKLGSLSGGSPLANLTLEKSSNGDTATTGTGTEGWTVLAMADGQQASAGAFANMSATFPAATLALAATITLLGTSSGSAPSMAGVTQDATSGRYWPSSSSEWATALAAAGITSGGPFALHNLQDLSGNPVDAIGAFPMTALNSPGYAASISGWSRKFITAADGSSTNLETTSASLPDPATTSVMMIAIADVTATPAAARSVGRIAATTNSTLEARIGTTPTTQVTAGAVSTNGTANPTTTPHLWILQHNVTLSQQFLLTDQELIQVPTFAALAGKEISLGKTVGALSAPCAWGGAAWFSGSAAEVVRSQLRKLMSVCNWPLTTL